MHTEASRIICRRNGCTLPRARRILDNGKIRLNSHCTQACVVWDQRAKRALLEGDADEANELLRLAARLDARTHPGQTVPGIFVDTRRKAA
ncbi:hypothetical protein [Streptomyces sp. OR43]|uniref:hypothetical protein n=1 Tax=Streptomyces sp. or43 TaxID=2478957 RepID=UPI0011CDF4ED|nr:hypothetical protein [Streptomyces sp. or43]TXS47638.1 hypothetical protein EAO72_07595 [Streptomyces sp. or43]